MDGLIEWLPEMAFVSLLIIFVAGVLAFILSTISGGGGTLVLVPIVNWLLGVSNTAPVLNLRIKLLQPAGS
ncbi:hypothetical protein [Ekhidna sp.]|uniref:hypothetical protein n=1 Tax=Ekhidna sp. TaxID=2608089 RepID=UPI003BAD282B